MNLVYGLALHEFSVAQWIGCPPEGWEVIGLNPFRDSDFFWVPRSFSSSHLFTEPKIYCLPFFQQNRKGLHILIKNKKNHTCEHKRHCFLKLGILRESVFVP